MEAAANNKAPNQIYQKYLAADIDQSQQTLEQYKQYKEEYSNLTKTLRDLPNEIEYDITVPIGPLAFMPGKLVHTNEILVLLGDNWFVERSASQASEMAKRREAYVDKQIQDLQNQLKVLKMKFDPNKIVDFGLENTNEVNEQGEPIFEIREEIKDEEGEDDGISRGVEIGQVKERVPSQNYSNEDETSPISEVIEKKEVEGKPANKNYSKEDQEVLALFDQFGSDEEEEESEEESIEDRLNNMKIKEKEVSTTEDDDDDVFLDTQLEVAKLRAHLANTALSEDDVQESNITLKAKPKPTDKALESKSVKFNDGVDLYQYEKTSSPKSGTTKGKKVPISSALSPKESLVKPPIILKNHAEDKSAGYSFDKIAKPIIKENETQEYNEDQADQDFLLREVSQKYITRRRQLFQSGKLEGMSDVAEQVLKEIPGVTFKDEASPAQDTTKEGGEDESDEDNEKVMEPEPNRIQLLGDNELGLTKRQTAPPQVVAASKKSVVESSPTDQSIEEKPKKMSLFKMKRMGLTQ